MTQNHEFTLRPAISFAVLKTAHLMLLSLVFLFLAWYASAYLIFFSIGCIIAGWCKLLVIRSNRYLIGKDRIRSSRGILFKRMDELEMYRIKDYIITQPPLLQLFGLMNVILKSTDLETPTLKLMGIPSSDLIDTIRKRVQIARQNNRIYEIN
ncbi:PH domain-containing protein [Mucilaginibacter terrenus]|uniref:PH domain-containing protein n=1 Tax=Mucilaginibacter terrenus TaxID=2482727 RepID=A0A3E2NWC9_9SPHI|nr:PH domain-containing protein [Mucilaginibacter terrenus]RFZ85267.1 PH domain-containing protein [Mucilaginibacter terrenus]